MGLYDLSLNLLVLMFLYYVYILSQSAIEEIKMSIELGGITFY